MDDFHWIWQTILIFYFGRLILRLGGRKSISQMTITQVVVMVGIGSLLIQPIAGENVWHTLAVGFLIVLLMIITEYMETKFDWLEKVSTGKAKMVIENGELKIKELKRLRMSVDRLETRLRQSGVTSIDDVKHATIEVSGQVGFELKDHKKPMTKEDFNILYSEIAELKRMLGANTSTHIEQASDHNIFDEIKTKRYEGDREP